MMDIKKDFDCSPAARFARYLAFNELLIWANKNLNVCDKVIVIKNDECRLLNGIIVIEFLIGN
jgi:hypothetical protein